MLHFEIDAKKGNDFCRQQLRCFKTHYLDLKQGGDNMESDQFPVGLMSYIIVPALPKNALVEWHVVALENQIHHQCKFKTLPITKFCLKINLTVTLVSSVKKNTGCCPFNQKFQFSILEISSGEWNSIFRNFQKIGQPFEVYQNFRKIFTGNFHSICVSPQNFQMNGSLLGNSTIFRVFGNFSSKFPYHLSLFEIFG